ncbi:hypothetical protein O3W44_22235 [Pantoea sp. LMR881]|uniref:hypothetical protein n=1 Tax=Pantoea sp. LMR881 TaxID=3014336 RepID=UPI0022AEF0D3|nr:hypothetical protein [Pantoea sp. LMR881]MCZ4061252.1 hypothetical protein [Pantoea sp. LMR881]
MALPQQHQSFDALAIIDAIEHASTKELGLLKDIHRAVIARNGAKSTPNENLQISNKAILNAIMSRRNAGNDNHLSDNRNYRPLSRIKTDESRNHLANMRYDARISNQSSNGKRNPNASKNQQKTFNASGARRRSAADAAKITAKSIQSAEKRLQSGGYAANDGFISQTNHVENHFVITQSQSQRTQNNANTAKWRAPAINSEQSVATPQRDANGRFTSKEKSEQDDERREKAENKSLFKKLGDILGNKKVMAMI